MSKEHSKWIIQKCKWNRISRSTNHALKVNQLSKTDTRCKKSDAINEKIRTGLQSVF